MDIKQVISSHEILKVLSREEVARVSELCSEKRFHKGEVIYRKDVPASHFFLVLEGSVTLFLPGTRQRLRHAVARVERGEMFGLSPVLGFDRYTVTAEAMGEVTLLALEARPFLALMKANPMANSHFVATVARSYYARYLGMLETLQGIVSQLMTPQ